jgi:hypothetical protein
MIRICSTCKLEKELNIDNFRQCKYSNGILYFKARCRECEKKCSTTWNNKNVEKTKAIQVNWAKKHPLYKKKWYEDNKEYVISYQKDYEQKNKTKILEHRKNRYKTDVCYRFRKNFSREIHRKIKNRSSIIKNIGYTFKELAIHLEKQFDSNMTWENYATYWEIDHVIPQSDLPYMSYDDENFKKCWALSNLRPLEKHINRSEGASRIRHKSKVLACLQGNN